MKSLYLLINIFSILFPLLWSFDTRVSYYKRWPSLFVALAITAAFFIAWDVWFTDMGVWGFNPQYLLGIRIFNLPLEECLFFFFIPYSCLFIYEVMKYYVPRDVLRRYARAIAIGLAALLLVVGMLHLDKCYTGLTFLLTAAFLLAHVFLIRSDYLGRFFIGYAVSLIPFLIVNGLLTGSFIPGQVVWYDDAENLGIRLFTIPIEDSVYMLLLLLMNTTIYEHLEKKKFQKRSEISQ